MGPTALLEVAVLLYIQVQSSYLQLVTVNYIFFYSKLVSCCVRWIVCSWISNYLIDASAFFLLSGTVSIFDYKRLSSRNNALTAMDNVSVRRATSDSIYNFNTPCMLALFL